MYLLDMRIMIHNLESITQEATQKTKHGRTHLGDIYF